jgi:hypothetical protein
MDGVTSEEEYSTNITWFDGKDENDITIESTPTNIPSYAELLSKMGEVQAEYDAQQFARDRVKEYPEIGDQLDALFHAGVFPAEMAAQIQAVKDKFPKA